VKVWVSPQKFNFETEIEVIKREIKESDRSMMVLLDINPDGTLKYQDNETYLNLYSTVVAIHRASKNNLRYHFTKLKESNGWKVVEIEMDEEATELGKEINRLSKELEEQDRITGILAAKLITRQEYEILEERKDREALSSDEEHAMRRYEIESFYLEDVSEDLIEMDNDGHFRNCVRNYERFYGSHEDLVHLDRAERKSKRDIPDREQRLLWRQTLQDIFNSAGLLGADKRIRTDVVIEGDSLDQFAAYCHKQKVKIENQFELPIRKGIKKNPTQQLGEFLRLLGLKLEKLKTKRKGKVKVYCYSVPESVVETLEAIKANRGNTELTKQWHRKREDNTDNRLFGSDNPLETEYQSVKRAFRSRR
jgi:flagellar biosynthesis chaperone FliJ